MDLLTQRVLAILAAHAGLQALNVQVHLSTVPAEPRKVVVPYLTLRLAGGLDEDERHGGAVRVIFECHLWGYRGNAGAEEPELYQAGQQVDEALLQRISVTGGGGTRRPRSDPGWQQIEQPDPLVILLRNAYHMTYWSTQRIAAL